MINRRTAITASLAAAAFPLASRAGSQTERDQQQALETLISEVVEGGDISLIPDLIAEDATIPDYDVEGIEMFTAISQNNHADRQKNYESYAFDIQAITAVDDWALAFVRFVGTTATGEEEDLPAFYATRFNADGLISEVYIGS